MKKFVKELSDLLLLFIGLALMIISIDVTAKDYLVKDQSEFLKAEKKIKPGDSIVLKNGTWNDFEILLRGKGTAEKPISLRAQDVGKVIISGQSNLRIAGEHLIVSGLVFKNGYTPTQSVISFRRTKGDYAYHSRITQIVIDNFNNPERTETDYWVAMYGKHNRFDHNHLEGKRNKGVTMAVRLDSEESRENHHRIDHNYFGPRPILGSNGGETLRIGTSHYSLSDSFTVVENNYFDRCDGELEIISNKSGGNKFLNNVFFESRGTLTMRHGNGNLVEDNVFFGNGVDHTGGIRVINKQQTIRNNYMEGLAGYRFGGALVVMNGVPNSPINRYHQVEDALIVNNTLINSDHIQLAAGSDEERSAVPVTSQFKNNLIYSDDGKDTFTVYDDVSGIEFAGNILNDVKNPQLSSGFTSEKLQMERASNGLMYPANDSHNFAGTNIGVSRDLSPIQKHQTGVDWYPKPESLSALGQGKKTNVAPGSELSKAIESANPGDQLYLAKGEYLVNRILDIAKPVSIIAKQAGTVDISFERSALFEIKNGGSLHLKGLNISGSKSPDSAGNSVIRTQRNSMLENYELIIEELSVNNLDINHSFNFINVAKSTFADRIEISDSQFSNVTGAILKLNAESDDYGIYNAEYVDIKNSTFTHVDGSLIDFYRGGTDESTFGPHFSLQESEVNQVGQGKRNKSAASLHLHGVQVTDIRNNSFNDSPAIRVLHTVGEPVTKINNNQFVKTGNPSIKELNSDKQNTAMITGNTFDGHKDGGEI